MLPRQTKRTDVRAGAGEVAAIGLWVRMLIKLRPSAPVEAAKLPLTLTLGKKAGYFCTDPLVRTVYVSLKRTPAHRDA
jgi:hypothetical protein